jgi:hypothetical protein
MIKLGNYIASIYEDPCWDALGPPGFMVKVYYLKYKNGFQTIT